MFPRIFWILLGALLLSGTANAKLRLPAILGDHMVLQQAIPLDIWGWGTAGGQVAVSMDGHLASAEVSHRGEWKATLPALKAGGPYHLTVTEGKESIVLKDVWVGEVWLGSGQSNMELPLSATLDAEKEIQNSHNPQIRIFTVGLAPTEKVQQDVQGSWQVLTPDSARNFSAAAYYFAKNIQPSLGVPVGMIASDLGGSPAESWVARPVLEKNPPYAQYLSQWDHNSQQQQLWKEGYSFGLKVSDLRLLPKDPSRNPVIQVGFGKEEGERGGTWVHEEKPGSKVDFDLEDHPDSGGKDKAGNFSGVLQNGGWATLATSFLEGGKPFDAARGGPLDLTGYETVEMRVEGKGSFKVSLQQASIVDNDFYGSTFVKVVPDQQVYRFSIKEMKQDGWGKPTPFTLERIKGLQLAVVAPWLPEVPSLLYNGMIAPLTPFKIKGVIWYQGEANVDRADRYRDLLSTLIGSWRKAWGEGDFPFYIVQLPNFMAPKPDPSESAWASLRQAQLEVAQSVPSCGLIPILDIGEAWDIHPKNKADVGKRLAGLALEQTYGKPVTGSCPMPGAWDVKDGQVALTFKNTGGGLTVQGGGDLKGFALAGSDHRFYWAQAHLRGSQVVVSSSKVPRPVELRYAWADNPTGNLFTREGLPTPTFRVLLTPSEKNP